MRRAWFGLAAVLALGVVALRACGGSEAGSSEAHVYPSVSAQNDGTVRLDLGPGSLETWNDDAWGGRSTLLFPPALDSDAGPVEAEILGLDLSLIDYRGGLGWPSDSLDAGALINVGLFGSTNVTYRIFSMVSGLLEDAGYEPEASQGLRAWAFHGYQGDEGPHGMHNFRVEEWGPEGERGPYNTFDIRLRLEEGVVSAWVRLHASLAWASGSDDPSAPCPWNVAIDNAAPGTADRVWSGQCRGARPGRAGRPEGAWVPVQGGSWPVTRPPGSVQLGISISNWQHAHGPYRIRWQNAVLRGPRDAGARWAFGGGRAVAFGTGQSRIEPRGAPVELRYVAAAGSGQTSDASFFHYGSSRFEVSAETTSGVLISAEETRILGTARVNGTSGHRYELIGIPGTGDDPARFHLQVWDLMPANRPLYTAFGSLSEGGLTVWP